MTSKKFRENFNKFDKFIKMLEKLSRKFREKC